MKKGIGFLFAVFVTTLSFAQNNLEASSVKTPDAGTNAFYITNQAPLLPQHLVKLPAGSIKPGGWLLKNLELQRDGLTGHLSEISAWLTKKNNAWLNKDGTGDWGWEEMPYWLK